MMMDQRVILAVGTGKKQTNLGNILTWKHLNDNWTMYQEKKKESQNPQTLGQG